VGMMFGFARERRDLLHAELVRMAAELPSLGARGVIVPRVFSDSDITLETGLELIVVHETEEPFHRRSDFFVTHLRPAVGTRFIVYTPEEFEAVEEHDPYLQRALQHGEVIDAPA
jgi:uncharacterized protein